MNFLILTQKDRISSNLFSVEDERQTHIKNVLQLNIGDSIEIGLLNTGYGNGKIISITNKEIKIEVNEDQLFKKSISPEIDLICALPRPQTLKRILNISGTFGIRKLYLIRTNRVEKSYFHSPLTTPKKQLPYLIEGLSQGKFYRLPEVSTHNKFKVFIEDFLLKNEIKESVPAVKILAHPDTEGNIYNEIRTKSKRLIIAIGPEGGWVPFETELMFNCGFKTVTLGDPVMRVETALTAALSQVELSKILLKD